ncbi:GTP-binding protein [Methanolobus chelungpuianus]|uniref:CobW/HypB/UreG nucleotide-binding domain-containing protein n=1 Tax=Methanolobus chelungpuianus TaxID=502115 RepID=A0AAE3KXY7_9EURY|nr:GTP-binding protein [Methanolobus chelungpuianus]MCQ6963291.1 hypothetical protein [Methanolobus chelungpuianus]
MQIVLIGGFAGSEKKDLVFSVGNELIARSKNVCALVIESSGNNERTTLKIDPAIIVKEMRNIPCTFVNDLVAELPEIGRQSPFDHLLVEVPFSLPPGNVKKAIVSSGFKDLSFAPVICMLDVNMPRIDGTMIPKIVKTLILESEIIVAGACPADKKPIAVLSKIFEVNPDVKVFEHCAGSGVHTIGDFVDMIINRDNKTL